MIRRIVSAIAALFMLCILAAPAMAAGRAVGTITDREGKPLKGVEVHLVPADRPDLPTIKVKTDKKGRYIIGLIRKSTYRITAFKEGYRVGEIDGNIAIPSDESFWAYKGPISPGGIPPVLGIDGLTEVTYHMVMYPDGGDPGEWGTGQPLLSNREIIERIQSGNIDAAVMEIQRSLEISPDDANLNYLMAFAMLQKRDLEAARTAIDKCLATNPAFEGANMIRGKLLESAGQTDEALAAYRAEIEHCTTEQVKKDALIAAALLLVRAEELEQAAALLEQVVTLDPENVAALKELANCYLQTDQKEKAEEILAKVASLGGSQDPAVLYNLGADAFNNKDFKTAAEYFEKTIAADSNFAEAFLQLGYCKLNLGEIPAAVENLKKFVEMRPDSPATPDAKAIVQSLSGN
ncbi:MAG: tetratricopeptide repeat protein [Acidobacteriota bacterium]|nr:tetratricopeptide repeat protein [Acidobacteriota bacterium]